MVLASSSDESSGAKKVLIIDDSDAVLRTAKDILELHGYRVFGMDDGTAATEVALELRPDLIFVDFTMPRVSGLDVCQQLGQHTELEAIPIVIMSTQSDPVSARFVRDVGIVDHISKPFAPEALAAVVAHTLGRNHVARDRRDRRQNPQNGESHRQVVQALSALGFSTAEEVDLGDSQRICAAIQALHTLDVASGLSGDITQCGLAEIFQMLGLQRQNGRIRVLSGDIQIESWMRNGAIRLVTGVGIPEEHRLGSILLRRGAIDRSTLDSLTSQRSGKHRRLGTLAVERGLIARSELEAAMRIQSSELVYEILRFGKGTFDFMRVTQLPTWVDEFGFELSVDELLMEGFRRVDEWSLIEAAIPSFDQIPTIRLHLTTRLTLEERKVLRLVDGTRTLRDVIAALGVGTFEGASLIYRLASSGVIALIAR